MTRKPSRLRRAITAFAVAAVAAVGLVATPTIQQAAHAETVPTYNTPTFAPDVFYVYVKKGEYLWYNFLGKQPEYVLDEDGAVTNMTAWQGGMASHYAKHDGISTRTTSTSGTFRPLAMTTKRSPVACGPTRYLLVSGNLSTGITPQPRSRALSVRSASSPSPRPATDTGSQPATTAVSSPSSPQPRRALTSSSPRTARTTANPPTSPTTTGRFVTAPATTHTSPTGKRLARG